MWSEERRETRGELVLSLPPTPGFRQPPSSKPSQSSFGVSSLGPLSACHSSSPSSPVRPSSPSLRHGFVLSLAPSSHPSSSPGHSRRSHPGIPTADLLLMLLLASHQSLSTLAEIKLIGRLTQDVNLATTAGGSPYASFVAPSLNPPFVRHDRPSRRADTSPLEMCCPNRYNIAVDNPSSFKASSSRRPHRPPCLLTFVRPSLPFAC